MPVALMIFLGFLVGSGVVVLGLFGIFEATDRFAPRWRRLLGALLLLGSLLGGAYIFWGAYLEIRGLS